MEVICWAASAASTVDFYSTLFRALMCRCYALFKAWDEERWLSNTEKNPVHQRVSWALNLLLCWRVRARVRR